MEIDRFRITPKGLDRFRITPNRDSASFSDWVSFSPSSHASAIGRRMMISKTMPKDESWKNVHMFEKCGWGKRSYSEFLKFQKANAG